MCIRKRYKSGWDIARLLSRWIPILMCYLQCMMKWSVSFAICLKVCDVKFFVVVGVVSFMLKMHGLLKSSEGFLVALEFFEGKAFAVVGVGSVGVKTDDLLKS